METHIDPTPARRLYKSRQNRIIDGICGGIAEYFDVDPTIVRLLWVFATLLGGSGFVLYILAMIIMPVNPNPVTATDTGTPAPRNSDRKRFMGVLLVLLGAFLLLMNLGWISDIPWWTFSGKVMLPVLLILVGALFLYTQTQHRSAPADQSQPAPEVQRDLRRSRSDKKLFGVCGGLARYFNIDPTIVRILFVVLVIASLGWGLLLYIILGIVMREEPFQFPAS